MAQFAHEKNQRALLISRVDQRGRVLHEEEEHKDEATGAGSPGKHAETEQADDAREKPAELVVLGELLHGDELKFSLKVQYYGHVAHTVAFLKRESYTVLDLKGDEAGEHVSKQL